MNTLREVVRWLWWIVSVADFVAASGVWIEMRRRSSVTWRYLERPQGGEAAAAFRTIIGLYLFGINVQAHLWYLFLGLAIAIYQGWATMGLFLYLRGILNGEGWFSLLKKVARPAQPGGPTKEGEHAMAVDKNDNQPTKDDPHGPPPKPVKRDGGGVPEGPGDKPESPKPQSNP